MTHQELAQLVACFDSSTAQVMKIKTDDFSLELSRGLSAPTAPMTAPIYAAPAAPAPVAAPVAEKLAIRAPLVGSYYAASSPDAPPFVTAGQEISKGQTVCLIEAMKMMSEVTAPCDCVIEEILQENGALVAFDAPLFHYRKK